MKRTLIVTPLLLILSALLTRKIVSDPNGLREYAFAVIPHSFSGFFHKGTLTAVFAHADWSHFWGNLRGWILVGLPLEWEIGSLYFAQLLCCSQLFCLIVSFAISYKAGEYLVGSSGALYGAMMFYLIFAVKDRAESQFGRIAFLFIFSAMFSQFLLMVVNAFPDSSLQISSSGHFGGILGAIVYWYAFYVRKNPDPPSTEDVLADALSHMH